MISNVIHISSDSRNIGDGVAADAIQDLLQVPQASSYQRWEWRPQNHEELVRALGCNLESTLLILGAGGLVINYFEPIWRWLQNNPKARYVIWGVGSCVNESLKDCGFMERELVREVFAGSELATVRDSFTKDHYGLESVCVNPCPSHNYIRKHFRRAPPQDRKGVLFVDHPELTQGMESDAFLVSRQWAERKGMPIRCCNNVTEHPNQQETYIREFYKPAEVVVTARLHGAIIARALGVPCMMFNLDEKMSQYATETNGASCLLRDLPLTSANVDTSTIPEPVFTRNLEFADQVRTLIDN